MLFVSRLTWRPGAPLSEVIARRAKWQYPEGSNVLGEYWIPGGDIIVIFETSSNADVLVEAMAWGEFFEIDTRPAITAEEGLAVASKMLGETN